MYSIGSVARIETLNKDNYDTWCVQMEALLKKNNGWKYVNGRISRPMIIDNDATTAAAAEAWDEKDQKAKSDLILCTSPSELKQIKGCETAREVWEKVPFNICIPRASEKSVIIKEINNSSYV